MKEGSKDVKKNVDSFLILEIADGPGGQSLSLKPVILKAGKIINTKSKFIVSNQLIKKDSGEGMEAAQPSPYLALMHLFHLAVPEL